MRNLTLGIVLIFASFAIASIVMVPSIPKCEEDQVLVGTGSFEYGRWTGYECGPALDNLR